MYSSWYWKLCDRTQHWVHTLGSLTHWRLARRTTARRMVGCIAQLGRAPRLRKITINGTVAASRVNSGLAKSPCHTLNDPEARTTCLVCRVHTCGSPATRDAYLWCWWNSCHGHEQLSSTSKCIRTLWFHDQLDDTGSSIKRTLPDFGRALAGMTQLRDLSISVGAPAVANFTHFLQVLGKFPYLKKLHLSYGTRPVMDDSPLALGVHNFRPIVPPSLEVLTVLIAFGAT